jgi:hypothetical protein
MVVEEKPVDKSPTSLVGDVTRAINDAWEFFLPATFRLLSAGIVVYWLAGRLLVGQFFGDLKANLMSVNMKDLVSVLDQYKLTSVAPIIALFLFSVFVYAFNRCVATIGNFVPLQFTYSLSDLLFTRCRGEIVWYRLPEASDPSALLQAIEVEIAKAKGGGYETLLDGVASWSKSIQEAAGYVHFGKFLLLWSLAWTVFLSNRPGVPHGILVRLVVILLAITYWIALNLVREAYSIEQMTHAKVTAALAMLTLEGRTELPAGDEHRTRIDSSIKGTFSRPTWWWLQMGSLQFLHSFSDVDIRRTIGRPHKLE